MGDRGREEMRARYAKRRTTTPVDYGVDRTDRELAEWLVEMFRARHPGMPITDLLWRPREALAFCDGVRQRLGNPDVPDDLILRLLYRRLDGVE